jgi:polyisoprenyl-teichoic acid--peptidoglycan teichoic acid transferase
VTPTTGSNGDKPYKKYHASRVPRPRVSRELAAAVAAPEAREPEAPAAKPAPAARPKQAPRKGPASNGRRSAPAVAPPAHDDGAGLHAVPAPEPRAPRRFLRWRSLLLIPLVLLIAFGVWAYLGYSVFNKAVAKSNKGIDRATRAALTKPAGGILSTPTTLLVLGSDQRGSEPARSDTIMLMRFDPKTHSVSQLSIPRDTYVAMAGHGNTKINEAYFWGGAPLSIQTVRSLTGVPINHIMLVNFRGFPDLIDSVGGVVVDVPSDITSWYSGDITVHFKKGPQLMNGQRALIYSRLRKVDSDFMRMGRQQQVVQALEKRIAQPKNTLRLPWIGAKFMKGVRTDLTTNELIALAYLQWRTKPAHEYKTVVMGMPTMIGGVSYVLVDPATLRKDVAQFLSH